MLAGLADESVCPTSTCKGYDFVGQALSPANRFLLIPQVKGQRYRKLATKSCESTSARSARLLAAASSSFLFSCACCIKFWIAATVACCSLVSWRVEMNPRLACAWARLTSIAVLYWCCCSGVRISPSRGVSAGAVVGAGLCVAGAAGGGFAGREARLGGGG